METRTATRIVVLTQFHIALLLCLMTFCVWAEEAPPAATPTVTAEQALAAYAKFKAAPEQNLNEAPTFLKFMQGGGAHTVLESKLLFWMYQDYPPDVQAVLYAAYMGGNLEAQLVTAKQGDDPAAGMQAVLAAYSALKSTHPTLTLPPLDELIAAQHEGRFAQALAAMRQ